MVFGGVAAILGALIWAWISAGSGYEIGWIAWIIGAAVGFGVVMGGGKGPGWGVSAATLTVVAIIAGKLLSASWIIGSFVEDNLNQYATQEEYNLFLQECEEIKGLNLENDNAVKQFMVMNDYTENQDTNLITNEGLDAFKKEQVEFIKNFRTKFPTYDLWRNDAKKSMNASISQEYPFSERLKDSLGFMDIIFFLLAIATSFKVVAQSEG